MKTLPKDIFAQIRQWVYHHARYLDITRWQYHFESGNADAVLHALAFYQNNDGGFGHGLEYDCLNPESSPVQFLWAASGILNEIGYGYKEHPMMQRVIKYFENCPYITEKGCFYAIPSNNHYPCNPWCLYTEEPRFPGDWLPEGENINAEFIETVFKNCDPNSVLYKKALKIINYRISILSDLEQYLLWNQNREWQGLGLSEFARIIQIAEEYNIKPTDECKILYEQLLSIIYKSGFPETYQKIVKQIDTKGKPQPSDLDKVIDDISHNKIWLKSGLYCDDPPKRNVGIL